MSKLFITGVTGFIGNDLTRKLVKEGQYDIYGLVRHCSRSKLEGITDLKDQIEIKEGNLIDYLAIRKIVKTISPDYILHLGAYTPVRYSFDQPIEYQQVNYMATINLVHTALELKNLKKFIFASTMETYGWQPKQMPFTEDLALYPASPYAVAKVAAEKYIQMAGVAYNLPYLIVKPCNTFGRKNDTRFVTEYITTSLLKGKPVHLGTPNAIRDMMYLDDHINAYLTCLETDVTNETLNFGCGLEYTMEELAHKIKDLMNVEGEIVHGFPSNYPTRLVTEEYLSLNATKAKTLLEWNPKINLQDGLKRTIDYWTQKLRSTSD